MHETAFFSHLYKQSISQGRAIEQITKMLSKLTQTMEFRQGGDNRQKLLYGAGDYGAQAMEFYGADQVYAFADLNKHDTTYLGKPVIHPSTIATLQDKYEIIICAKNFFDMVGYLNGIGVQRFRIFEPSVMNLDI